MAYKAGQLLGGIRISKVHENVPLFFERVGMSDPVFIINVWSDNSQQWIECEDDRFIDGLSREQLTEEALSEAIVSAGIGVEDVEDVEDSLQAEEAEEGRESVPEPVKLSEEEQNFIAPIDPWYPTLKEKMDASIAALKLLKDLEADDRLPTKSEKLVLSRYVGFAGDKEVLNSYMGERYERQISESKKAEESGRYFYPSAEVERWGKRHYKNYQAIKAILSDEEFKEAEASVLTSFWTDTTISRKLWEVAEQAGFEGGTIWEPAHGIGNIMSVLPEQYQLNSSIVGHEKNSIAARIAKKLYPQNDIVHGVFQDAEVRDNSVDLVITNVPFSSTAPAGQNTEVKYNLHNYCIAEGLQKLKPGGIMVAITSASTMEKNPEQRNQLASLGVLLGAFRLPNNAFESLSSTEVVSDILVFSKGEQVKRRYPGAFWSTVLPVKVEESERHESVDYNDEVTITEEAFINEYFVKHPGHVLGLHSLRGKMYGNVKNPQYTVQPKKESVAELMDAVLTELPSLSNEVIEANVLSEELDGEYVPAPSNLEQGQFYLDDTSSPLIVDSMEVDRRFRNISAPVPWERTESTTYKFPRGFNATKASKLVCDFVELRDALLESMSADLGGAGDEESQQFRRVLNLKYNTFVESWGYINANPSIYRILSSDFEFYKVCALESVVKNTATGKLDYVAADILNKRTLFPEKKREVKSVRDGLMHSLAKYGTINVGFIAGLLSEDKIGVRRSLLELEDVFLEPISGELVHSMNYLRDDVVSKFSEVEKRIEAQPELEKNRKALEKIQPEKFSYDSISFDLSSNWLDRSLFREFFGRASSRASISYFSQLGRWEVESTSYNFNKEYETDHADGKKILRSALSGVSLRVNVKHSMGNGNTVTKYSPAESKVANRSVERLNADFKEFVAQEDARKVRVENSYNSTFNRTHEAKFDGSFLEFPGLCVYKARDHQADFVARAILDQSGVAGHKVGYGKTLELIMSAMELSRMGIANKPMIVCDNPSYAQFVATAREAYPQARILVSDEVSMNSKNRKVFLNRIMTGSYDFVILPQSHFDLIPVSPSTQMRWMSEELSQLEAAIDAGEGSGGSRHSVRKVQAQKEKMQEKLIALRDKLAKGNDRNTYFEDLGVDFLLIDEIHKYKKSGIVTAFADVKGIDTGRSQRGVNLLMKAGFIQDQRGGRGVIGATGTPITNTMAEAWNVLRLTRPNSLKNYGVTAFDHFITSFCETVTELELNESNNRWRVVERLAKFKNGVPFIRMIREGIDVKMDPIKQVAVPSLVSGQPIMNVVEQTDTVAFKLDMAEWIYNRYESFGSELKEEYSFVPIMLMQAGTSFAIDPRLIDPSLPDQPNSLIDKVVSNALRLYRESADSLGTQAIFADRYNTMSMRALAPLMEMYESNMEQDGPQEIDLGIEYDQGEEPAEEAVSVDGEVELKFNLYDEIKRKCMQGGIPEAEIAIMTNYVKPADRKSLFDRVNSGSVRIVIGSTYNLGTGVNIQQRLVGAHHVDPPRSMTPADLEQRNGRILRQGNRNSEVEVHFYGMKDTAIPGILHRIQRKEKFISQALSGVGVGMEFESPDGGHLEAQKSALISDKRQLRRAELLGEIRDLKQEQEAHVLREGKTKRDLRDAQNFLRGKLASLNDLNPAIKEVVDLVKLDVKDEARVLQVDGKKYIGKKAISEQLKSCIDQWNKVEIPMEESDIKLASIEIDGAKLMVGKLREHAFSREEGRIYFQSIVKGVERERKVSLYNYYYSSVTRLMDAPKVLTKKANETLAEMDESLENAKVQEVQAQERVNRLKEFDAGKLNDAIASLDALEVDMRENPYDRRKKRRNQQKGKTVIDQSDSLRSNSVEQGTKLNLV